MKKKSPCTAILADISSSAPSYIFIPAFPLRDQPILLVSVFLVDQLINQEGLFGANSINMIERLMCLIGTVWITSVFPVLTNGFYSAGSSFICTIAIPQQVLQNVFVQIAKCIFPNCDKLKNITTRLVSFSSAPPLTILHPVMENIFIQFAKCTCPNLKMYFYELTNVFVQIAKCIRNQLTNGFYLAGLSFICSIGIPQPVSIIPKVSFTSSSRERDFS